MAFRNNNQHIAPNEILRMDNKICDPRSIFDPVLTRHRLGYWRTLECLGGFSRPLLSRELLVVESRAKRHSKALHKTHPNLLSELKIEVTCEVKVRSNIQIRRFDVLGPGDQDYRTRWLKLRKNVVKGMVKIWYEYKRHTKKT